LDLTRDLALRFFLFEVLALIGLLLSFANADLDFDPRAFPVEAQGNERLAFDLAHAIEAHDFFFVEEEPPDAFGIVLFPARFIVGLDIASIEEALAILDAGEGVAEIDPTVTDRLDLGATQLDPSLESFEDLKVVERLAIVGDFRIHLIQSTARKRVAALNGFRRIAEAIDEIGRDLAFDDFQKGDITLAEAHAVASGIDERGAALVELAYATRHEIDKDRGMGDYLRGFVDQFGFHVDSGEAGVSE
jgi:hypothetical protein